MSGYDLFEFCSGFLVGFVACQLITRKAILHWERLRLEVNAACQNLERLIEKRKSQQCDCEGGAE